MVFIFFDLIIVKNFRCLIKNLLRFGSISVFDFLILTCLPRTLSVCCKIRSFTLLFGTLSGSIFYWFKLGKWMFEILGWTLFSSKFGTSGKIISCCYCCCSCWKMKPPLLLLWLSSSLSSFFLPANLLLYLLKSSIFECSSISIRFGAFF